VIWARGLTTFTAIAFYRQGRWAPSSTLAACPPRRPCRESWCASQQRPDGDDPASSRSL